MMLKSIRVWNIIFFMFVFLVAPVVCAEKLSPRQIMDYMQIKLEKGFTKKDLASFRKIVKKLDLDGNGSLSIDEYGKNPHFRGNPRGTQGFFRAADMDQDGQMSINEYAWQRIITDEARKIYFAMDRNKDRRLSKLEFLDNKILRTKNIAESIFTAFDTDGNGELILPEYLRKWSRWARIGRQLGSLY
ncbi:MAG: hypothetical protein VX693_09230 [Pseudomonadota bacterium]|nr:hypothetical protein [Pseudomonadota bacterium]